MADEKRTGGKSREEIWAESEWIVTQLRAHLAEDGVEDGGGKAADTDTAPVAPAAPPAGNPATKAKNHPLARPCHILSVFSPSVLPLRVSTAQPGPKI